MILVALLMSMLAREPQALRWTNDASANKYVLATSFTPSESLVIMNSGAAALITISLKDGHVTYGAHYTPDAAARVFWDSVAAMYGKNCEAKK